jgi:hypothetical protein
MRSFALVYVSICLFVLFLPIKARTLDYDFSDAGQLKDWEIIGGDWKIENGVLRGEKVPAAGGFDHGPGILVGEEGWTDYEFQFRMKIEDGEYGPGPIIRYVDERNWYYFETFRTQFFMRPHLNGEDQAPDPIPGAIWKESPLTDGKWHTVKIKAEGENIAAWVDGKKVFAFKYTDLKWGRPAHPVDEGLKRGRVGFTTWTEAPGSAVGFFDDVRIEGPGIPPSAVHPTGKLAAVWGRIKS